MDRGAWSHSCLGLLAKLAGQGCSQAWTQRKLLEKSRDLASKPTGPLCIFGIILFFLPKPQFPICVLRVFECVRMCAHGYVGWAGQLTSQTSSSPDTLWFLASELRPEAGGPGEKRVLKALWGIMWSLLEHIVVCSRT